MKKTFIRLFSAVLLVVILLSPTVLSGLRKTNMPITESFSTRATAASFLSESEAARYVSLFYEAGSSSYDLAYSALIGESQGTPETWASIATGISLFAGVSNEVDWDNLLCDASEITTSNITHITGAISGMFDIMDSIDNIKESESALRTSYEGLKIVKGLFDVFGKGSCFPSTLSLIMVSVDATLCVAGFLADQYFQEALVLYEADIMYEYYAGLPLTYKTIITPNPGSGLSVEETQQAYDVIYFKYLSKRMIDNIGGGSSGGGTSDVPVEDVSLSLSSCTIFNNQIPTIAATVYPYNATNKTITYSSSDTSIATVNSEGVITPIDGMYGKVTIYATAHNGVRESCEITILPFLAVKTDDSCQIVSYIGSGGVVEIPSQVNIYKVTSIGTSAFKDNNKITKIIIPDSVVNIESSAFYGCNNLSEVIIGTGIETIKKGAFYECVNLTKITINGNLASVGDYAFAYCEKLLEIRLPNSVESIGEAAFHQCSSLKGVILGNKVSIIGPNAFSYCSALNEITIPNSVINIGDYAFYKCSSLKELTMPVSTKICNSEYTFGGCVNIEKIILTKGNGSSQNYTTEYDENGEETYVNYTPWYISGCSTVIIDDGVKEIPPHIFIACTKLEYVSIGNSVTNIGDSAFNNCISLTSVEIPDSVTSIGRDAFFRCKSLTSVEIPDSVTSIGGFAFSYCASLTSVEIPDSVTSIGRDAFYDCASLTSVTVDEANTMYSSDAYGVLFDKEKTELILYPAGNTRTSYSIPNGVISIGGYAFYYCTSLTSIEIPDSVTNIGSDAFYYCTSLTSVEIPDSVTDIGKWAFYDCTSLTSVEIPDSVTSIGGYAFGGCTGVVQVTIPASLSVAESVFYGCESIEKITLTKGTGIMPNYSFSQEDNTCYQNTVWYKNRDNCTEIIIEEGVTNIGDYAFYMCTGLKTIVLPDSVTKIGEWAFYGCSNLTNVTIPDGVTDIEKWAFYDCTNINSVTLGDNIINIGNNAFNHCINLTNLKLPDKVTTIGDYAFTNCVSLSNVTIPKSVEQIGCFAFGGCRNISIVNYTGSKNDWESIAIFDGNDFLFNTNFVCEVTIDFATNTISGFNAGETSLDSYTITVKDNYVWEYETSSGKLGTGSKAILKDGGTVISEYTILVYGDTNGDSWYDGQDAVFVSCLANGMLTQDDVSEAVYMAADCNHDGVIDQLDVDLLNQAGTLLANVDQSKPTEVLLETSSEYVEYISLIDQSPEIEIEIEDETDAEETPEADTEKDNEQTVIPENDTEETTTTEFELVEMLMALLEKVFSFIRFLLVITF